MNMTTLYKITATGALQIWRVTRHTTSIEIMYGQLNGRMQYQWEDIYTNLSGRSLAEQVELRADSRINKQLDKGYCYNIEEAQQSIGLNANKMIKPMLAQQYKNRPVDHTKCFIQYKYNGHRCLITNTGDGIMLAYSRNGKPINSIPHILKSLEHIGEGVTLDGELYLHDTAIQDAGSLIRKTQPGSEKLEFICYDIVDNAPYEYRLEKICGLADYKYIKVAPTKYGNRVQNLNEELNEALVLGYEGLILRQGEFGYEAGKRSASLIKVKQWLDEEFRVIEIYPSKDGWAVLLCITDKGRIFRVSAPGTMQEKTKVLLETYKYIGEWVNVEFYDWTNDGIPFHPVARYWRSHE